ncbi:MAG: hypothetical protein V4659_05145 [Pseudomonadota bacterium]
MFGFDLRPGRHALAVFFASAALTGPAFAQTPARPAPRPAAPAAPRVTAPDALGASKLLSHILIAIDQANKTGNYTVLLQLGSAQFQASNSATSLGAVFQAFRQQQIDLSDILILSPTYEIAPAMTGPDTLRMRGSFRLPRGVLGFDMIFRWDNGWRIEAVSLLPPK